MPDPDSYPYFRPVRSTRQLARFRWWLLPHVGYYAEGWNRAVTAPARWLWLLTAYLPGAAPYDKESSFFYDPEA